eukprot:jgi/Astpho2/7953/Aster-x0792
MSPDHSIEQHAEAVRHSAIVVIQSNYRGHKCRRELAGFGLSKGSSAWQDLLASTSLVLNNLQFREADIAPSNSIRKRWVRASHSASKLGKGSAGGKGALLLRYEHWLEATDAHHRYGSNLHPYHQHWHSSSTMQPFFYWLDFGDGKELDLPSLPRRKLEAERLHYCTAQERTAYSAAVNSQGQLHYVHSEELIHTLTLEETLEVERDPEEWRKQQIDSVSVKVAARGHALAEETPEEEAARKEAKHKRNANKWIFVTSADGQQLYVAPKVKGNFQHSSFLAGGSVGAAGAIAIYHGRILKLAPLSGHYTPDLSVFLTFLDRHVNVNLKDHDDHEPSAPS